MAAATHEGIPRQIRYEAYRHQMLRELELAKLRGNSYGTRTNKLIHSILSKSKPPTTAVVHFCTEDEASVKAELGSAFGPIFTHGQRR